MFPQAFMPVKILILNTFCRFGSGTGIMEYKTNQISGIEIKEKKDADEAAIIENYKPFSTIKSR
jgi:hypothetical protein